MESMHYASSSNHLRFKGAVFYLCLVLCLTQSASALPLRQAGVKPIEDVVNLQLESSLKSELEKKFSEYLKKHGKNETVAMPAPSNLKLADIKVEPETLENMSMEEVFKIAEKGAKKNTNYQPIDLVVQFLRKEQKLIQQKEEEKR